MKSTITLGNVILRKEFFGGLICNIAKKTYHQINHDAYIILDQLKQPRSFRFLQHQLQRKHLIISDTALEVFLNKMQALGVIQSGNKNGALVFGDNGSHSLTAQCLRAPSSVSIYITQFCPKQCKHCVTNSSPYIDRSDEVSTKDWLLIIDKLRKFGVATLVFTGGDCLAKENIFEIMQKADKENFLIGVLTDYDGINSTHINELMKLKNLADLQTSLDGGTVETHDWMRGKGSFIKTLRRMNMFKAHRLDYTLSCVIHKKNLHEIDQLVEIYQDYGATHLYLNPLCPYGRGKYLSQYFLEPDELYYLGQKYLQLVAQRKISSGNPFWESNLDKLGDPSFSPFASSLQAVSTGFFSMSINWRGECYLDSKLSSEKILYLGNALNDDMHDIWFNPKLEKVRALYAPGAAFIHQKDFVSYLSGTFT